MTNPSNDPILYEMTRGSDLNVKLAFDEDGVAIDMTGWTASVFEVLPAQLAASVAVDITAPLTGEVNITCPWSNLWPVGTGAVARIRTRLDGFPDALPELVVVLK